MNDKKAEMLKNIEEVLLTIRAGLDLLREGICELMMEELSKKEKGDNK